MTRSGNVRLTALGLVVLAPTAAGFPSYGNRWEDRYPSSTLDERMTTVFGSGCYVCHMAEDFQVEGTCYRMALKARLDLGDTIQEAFAFVEPLDSDADGVSNLDEILMPRADLPGEVGYHPGRAGPLGLSPCHPPEGTFLGTGASETPPPAECAGDANGDNLVNSADLSVLLGQFGQGVTPGMQADFNADGFVDAADLSVLLARFGTSC